MKTTLLLLALVALASCQKELPKTEPKNDWENAKIGDVWVYVIDEEDPFVEPFYVYYTIKEIKKGYMKCDVLSIKKGEDTIRYKKSYRLSDLKFATKK
jgi:hypothetical protein